MLNLEKKNEVRYFNLRINAQDASFENLNIGPNLSPFMKRDKINQFCIEFNNTTSIYLYKDIPLYLTLYLYTDNSFFFIIKGPSVAFLLKMIFDYLMHVQYFLLMMLQIFALLCLFLLHCHFYSFFFPKLHK